MTERSARLLLALNLVLFFAFAFWCRATSLETAPPGHGDEALFGEQAEHLVHGERMAGRTGSGKPIDMFYTAVAAPLFLVFEPSYGIERIPAVLFGILAIVLTYNLGKRFLDRLTALIAAGFVAALPVAVINSRFGWEYSEVPLLSLLVIFFAATANRSRGHRIGLFVSYLAGTHVSPTLVFLAPVAMGLLLVQWFESRRTASERDHRAPLLAPIAFALLTVILGVRSHTSPTVRWTFETYDFGSCDWPRFLALYMKHHLGFIGFAAGETHSVLILGVWCLLAALLAFGSWRLVRDRAWQRLALVAGAVLSAAGYHLVVGPEGLHPKLWRYGVFLIVPNAFAIACLVRSVILAPGMAGSALPRRIGIAAIFLVGWGLMFSYRSHWFGRFEAAASQYNESFWTFQTETPETMQMIARLVMRESESELEQSSSRPIGIVTDDWWSYKPLQFLLSRHKLFRVGRLDGLDEDRAKRAVCDQLCAGGYVVGREGGPADTLACTEIGPRYLQTWVIAIAGRETYIVHRQKAASTDVAARPNGSGERAQ